MLQTASALNLSRVDAMQPLILELNGAALRDGTPPPPPEPALRAAAPAAPVAGLHLQLRGIGKHHGARQVLAGIEMHRLIESLWQRHGFTALLVTHDVAEAVAVADRVLLIEDGGVALDRCINLPRPRAHGSAAFARHEGEILGRVLQRPAIQEPAVEPLPIGGLRSAV